MAKALIIVIVLFCALLGSVAQLLFKMASSSVSSNILSWLNWKIIVGGLLYLAAGILFIWALKFGNLSVLYPIIATSYIWTAFLAFKFLDEPIPVIRWLGIALIIVGVILVVK